MKPATAREIIEALSRLEPDLPCFFRPKYHGSCNYTDSVPVNPHGICEMHPDQTLYPELPAKNITFLC